MLAAREAHGAVVDDMYPYDLVTTLCYKAWKRSGQGKRRAIGIARQRRARGVLDDLIRMHSDCLWIK